MQAVLGACDEMSPSPSGAGPGLLLQGGAGQLVGQGVPALHLRALVFQTVDPVLQGVSLRVAPEGHPP